MDRRGRVVGMLIFILGIVLLLGVLWIAFKMFTGAESAFLPPTPAPGAALPTSALIAAILSAVVKIGLLFVMVLASSSIAGRGIQLYLGNCEMLPRRNQE